MIDAAVTGGRRRGRPREQRADRAIIDAALELFAEVGYLALSVEAVAARAEVSKATLYRRWAGKRELVIEALATLNDDFPLPAPGIGDTRGLLTLAMNHMAQRDPSSLAGRIMPRMMIYSVTQPDLYAEYFERVIMPRRQWLYSVLRRGIEAGELRPNLDVELAAMALIGPLLLHAHSPGHRRSGDKLAEDLMDILWPGMAAGTAPAPTSLAMDRPHTAEPAHAPADAGE